ncbi:MAG: hypothetical protein LBP35_06945 [Candidatus Ancillula trichonymphae]|nr:hypothetical protein [Candidatus Ancillula trichonymphae]
MQKEWNININQKYVRGIDKIFFLNDSGNLSPEMTIRENMSSATCSSTTRPTLMTI